MYSTRFRVKQGTTVVSAANTTPGFLRTQQFDRCTACPPLPITLLDFLKTLFADSKMQRSPLDQIASNAFVCDNSFYGLWSAHEKGKGPLAVCLAHDSGNFFGQDPHATIEKP